jgi:glucose/arabinose dehydrogenase
VEAAIVGFARIRDVVTGPDGSIYLLIEHKSGGQIARLLPTDGA